MIYNAAQLQNTTISLSPDRKKIFLEGTIRHPGNQIETKTFMYDTATGQLEREFAGGMPTANSNDGIRATFDDDGAKQRSCAFSSDGSFHVRGQATLRSLAEMLILVAING